MKYPAYSSPRTPDTETRLVVTLGSAVEEGGNGESLLLGFPFGAMKIFWNMTAEMVAYICEYTESHGTVPLKWVDFHDM